MPFAGAAAAKGGVFPELSLPSTTVEEGRDRREPLTPVRARVLVPRRGCIAAERTTASLCGSMFGVTAPRRSVEVRSIRMIWTDASRCSSAVVSVRAGAGAPVLGGVSLRGKRGESGAVELFRRP